MNSQRISARLRQSGISAEEFYCWVDRIAELPAVRPRKVAQVRNALESRTYNVNDKIDTTLAAMESELST